MLGKQVVRAGLLLSLVLGLGAHLAMAGVAGPVLSLIPSSQEVQPGQSFSLDVHIASVTDLYAFEFALTFTPGVLAAQGVTEGTFLPSGGSTFFVAGTFDNAAGTGSATADSLLGAIAGVDGSGTLATIDFDALTEGLGSVSLVDVILLSSLGEISAAFAGDASVTVRTPEPVPGESQSNPLLPTSMDNGRFEFRDVSSGLWFDPPFTSALSYTIESPALFTQILDFPTGFGPLTVSTGNQVLGTTFGPGQSLQFPGGGVQEFLVSGISPEVDLQFGDAFPLQIAFSQPTATFRMEGVFSPTAIPEPGTWLLLATGLVSLGTYRWRQRRRAA